MENLSTNLILFVAFSAVVAIAYRVCPDRYRKYLLLLGNMVFYYCCSARYLVFILIAGLWSYYVGRKLSGSGKPKRWVWAGVLPLVSMLCVFKYWMPFLDLLNIETIGSLYIILPLGMSYYILKSLSYIFDIYRGKQEAERDLVAYMTYVTFFAQIIAGPIQRYEEWSVNLRKNHYKVSVVDGYYYIVQGLFMKVVIANRLSDYVLQIFASPSDMNGIQLWLGFLLYSFYIYFDFAGYSNMAIGVTQCFGIDCVKNFRRPYLSVNIKDFWSRWHISLSSWLKDYIYIPLGGNRRGKLRKYINVMATFLISGMWHGSTLNFVVWGAYHGVLNSFNYKKVQIVSWYGIIWRVALTFILVSVGWVFFATQTIADAFAFFHGMFCRFVLDMNSIQTAILPFTMDNTCLAYFLVVFFFIAIAIVREVYEEYFSTGTHKALSFLWQVFLQSSILLFGMFENTSFIYAGF